MSGLVRRAAALTMLALVAVAANAWRTAPPTDPAPDDWPQFLGPTRDGRSTSELARRWGGEGPPVLWRRSVGEGFASPSVVSGTLILFHRVEDEEVVEALDVATGRERWRTAYSTDYEDREFGFDEGPRAAPTIVDRVVYTCGAQKVVQALDLATGKRLWSVDARQRFDTIKGPFGAACQPFWVDGKLLMMFGGRNGAGIVALDAATGDTAWTATDHEASYAAPMRAQIGGQDRVFFFTRFGLVDLDPATGAVRSILEWHSRSLTSVNAAAPVLVGERVFVSAAYGTGAALVQVEAAEMAPLWSSDDVLSNHYATSIHRDGVLYGYHGRQPENPALRAVDAGTGRVLWSRAGFGGGSLLMAGSLLVILRENGELLLADVRPDRFRQRAKARILDPTVRAYPALADGVLYARNERELIAVDLRPQR